MRPANAFSKTKGVWASDTAVDGEKDYWLNRMQFLAQAPGRRGQGTGGGP